MASTESAIVNGGELSAAQKLQQLHDEEHKVAVEEVPDEDDLRHGPTPVSSSILESVDEPANAPGWVAPISAKAAGKQKEQSGKENKPILDTQSEEAFPGLGGPKPVPAANSAPTWGAKKSAAVNGAPNGIATNGTSAPASGLNTPASQPKPRAPQSLAGQSSGPLFVLQPQEVLSRNQLKRPIPDVLRDINKKTRANVSMTTGEGGVLKFSATGAVPDSVKHQAFKDLGAQICAKSSIKVPVPRSSKAHIIGKGGVNIKSMQEATGARIQLPKDDGAPVADDDDEDEILVALEGTPFAIALAKAAIGKTLNERSTSVNTKVRNVPSEFFPFIGGRDNSRTSALEEKHGIQIRVPANNTWATQTTPKAPSAGQPARFAPSNDSHITLAGDRAAVQAARAEIDQIVQELQQRLTLKSEFIPSSRHQYIIGERGIPSQDFFAKTGCTVLLPSPQSEEQDIIVIGPSQREVDAAIEEAINLASSMQNSSFDVSRQFRNAPGGGRNHARFVTQYLRDRNEIERLEKFHQTHIVTPISSEGADPWEIYYREGAHNLKAQSEINGILNAHPPTRFSPLTVDPFFHAFIKKDITPVVKKDYGVHVVVPTGAESSGPVLLVFEGQAGPEYQVPRGQPSSDDVKAFKQGLEDARKHILDIIQAQSKVTSTEIDVPKIFHEKLKRFIKTEQEQRSADQTPVRVSAAGTKVTLRGPEPAVEALASKVNAFIAEAIEDEKERGFTLSFDFPQKHANQLIGKGGSHIRELRDKFDVEINLEDGKVTLKGPKAKAEAAKTKISALGRQWADETTHVLKIDPQFHGEIIGSSGSQINRLQDRYKVQIHFPRANKAPRDDQSNADAASDAGRRPRREQGPDEVSVKGPTKGADGAREEILSLLQYLKDNSNSAIISVQAGQIPSLIGQKGREMDEIRQATGAKIEIPNARDLDPSTRVDVQVKGTASQVAEAKKLIAAKRDVFDQTVTKTVDVKKKHHRALIGREGSALREIVVTAGGSDDRRELARTIQFPKAEADGNTIKVEGKSDVVDKIIAAFQKIVADLDSQTSETIEVPTIKHRILIGRGGEAKRDLEKKFKVSIDIPRQGSEETGVKISGQPADVENAKTHIEGLVKEQEGETVQVARNVHHSVADNGQFFRRLRNDLGISVDHGNHKLPPKPAAGNARANKSELPLITDDADEGAHSWNVVSSAQSDLEGKIPWILRGPADNIPKAKSTLAAAIEQALKNTSTGYLVLPDPTTYRHVIGQGGSKVNSIRKASGCKITVPKAQAANEAIEVVGSAEGVEKAKELILQAIKDGASNNGGNRGYRNERYQGGGGLSTSDKPGQGNWD